MSQSRLIREDNQEETFKVECWDWEEEGEAKHQFIGEVYLNLPALKGSSFPLTIPLQNRK